jgi:hypothetical protein
MTGWREIFAITCTLFFGSVAWSQPAGGKLPHACDILTKEDAEYAFGKGASLFRSGGNCNIQPIDKRFLTRGVIEARIDFTSDPNWAATKRAFMSRKAIGTGVKQVSGLGDEAYITSPVSLAVSLHLQIKKGTASVSVSGVHGNFETREEIIRYIGERLLAGL